MNTSFNYIVLYLLIATLFGLSSAYFYWLLSKNMVLKKQQAKYISIFFIFISLTLLSTPLREFGYTSLSILLSCTFGVTAIFSFRQALLMRYNSDLTPLFKNKWLYINIIMVVFVLNYLIFYLIFDILIMRISILLTDVSWILYGTLFTSFYGKKRLTSADKVVIGAVISIPLLNLLIAIISHILDMMQWFFVLLLIAQILQIFLWTMAFAIILMSDVMEVHYQNSITDGLTKLFNRGYFTEYINQHTNPHSVFVTANQIEIINPSRDNYEHGLLFIDIDFFKKVNDNYGHSAGDIVIIQVANIIKDSEKNAVVSRFGGEEFAVFLEHRDPSQTLQVANAIRQLVEESTIEYEDVQIKVTVSIGVTNINHTTTIDDALKVADARLYKAKQTGRNKVCYA